LQQAPTVVVDLSGVNSIDSAGIGELALLQARAKQESASLKYAGPSPLVSELLELTNLDSVLELHPTVDAALATFHNQEIQDEGQQVCADR
jgi:anti-anti-sigma factor